MDFLKVLSLLRSLAHNFFPMHLIKGLKTELTCTAKSPLAPLCQRGVIFLPLEKGGEEGFYKTMSSLL